LVSNEVVVFPVVPCGKYHCGGILGTTPWCAVFSVVRESLVTEMLNLSPDSSSTARIAVIATEKYCEVFPLGE
jgi:hypothetical protein